MFIITAAGKPAAVFSFTAGAQMRIVNLRCGRKRSRNCATYTKSENKIWYAQFKWHKDLKFWTTNQKNGIFTMDNLSGKIYS